MSASERLFCVVLGLMATLLPALDASAERVAPRDAGCHGERPWILVDLDRVAEATGFPAAILAHLNAGFGAYGLRACSKPGVPARAPLAEITITSQDGDNVRVSVEVRDAVTAKRVARDIDVSGYTREGRAFAIAATAEELVRASWAELGLRGRRAQTPPPEVAEVVRDSLSAGGSRDPKNRLGTRISTEHFGGGQTHFGGDIFFEHWLGRRVGVALGFGPRLALQAELEPVGAVVSRALAAELMLLVSAVRGEELGLVLELGGRGGQLVFEGRPPADSSTRADRATAPFVSVRAGPALLYTPVRVLAISLRAGAGVVALGAEATANGRPVTAISGFEAHLGLAVGAVF